MTYERRLRVEALTSTSNRHRGPFHFPKPPAGFHFTTTTQGERAELAKQAEQLAGWAREMSDRRGANWSSSVGRPERRCVWESHVNAFGLSDRYDGLEEKNSSWRKMRHLICSWEFSLSPNYGESYG